MIKGLWATLTVIVIVFLCGLVSAIPAMNFLNANLLQPFSVQEGNTAQQAIQRLFGVNMPTSASGFYYANLGNQGYWLQIRMNPHSLNGLFRGSAFMTCSFPLQDGYRPNFEFERLLNANQRIRMSWWSPENVTRFVGGECTGRDYKIFRMFADSSNATTWTFYLEVVART